MMEYLHPLGNLALCTLFTFGAMCALTAAATAIYVRFVWPDPTYIFPSMSVTFPVIVWSSFAAGALFDYALRLKWSEIALAVFSGLIIAIMMIRGRDHLIIPALGYVWSDIGPEWVRSVILWLILPLSAALGLATANGLRMPSEKPWNIPMGVATLALGVVVLIFLCLPLARTEVAELDFLSGRLKSANEKVRVLNQRLEALQGEERDADSRRLNEIKQ